jgi:hypothetical protein
MLLYPTTKTFSTVLLESISAAAFTLALLLALELPSPTRGLSCKFIEKRKSKRKTGPALSWCFLA